MTQNSISIGYRNDNPINGAAVMLALAGFVPHLLWVLAQDFLALTSLYICFPAGMGFFSLIHVHLIQAEGGLISPLAWTSALFFTALWQIPMQWLWRESRALALLLYVLGLLIPAGVLWLRLMPLT